MRSVLLVALWSCGLVLASGCDQPQVGSPGLEPPRPREPEANDGGVDSMGMQPSAMAGGGHGGAGGGPTSGGSAGTGAPVVTPPNMSAAGAGAQAGDAAAEPDTDAGAPRADNPLFVGLWVVEQPTHALYEATLYELLDGGELVEHDTYLLGAPAYDGYVTGTVANADSSLRCDIRGPWSSDGERRLQLDSECTDGQQRAVLLVFADGDPAVGLIPSVESVAGESGWEHRDFAWSWRKCPSRDDCQPF